LQSILYATRSGGTATPGRPRGVAAEVEGEIFVGAGVLQPQLVEAEVVKDHGAAAAVEHVAVRQDDALTVVEDVQDGVVVTTENDGRRRLRPLALAGDLQVGVAAGVGCSIVIVIGYDSGCAGEVEGISDRYVAAHRRFQAHGSVIGGQGRSRVAMGGGGGMDGEEDKEEDEREAW